MCVPKEEIVPLIRKVHTSEVVEHIGGGKTMSRISKSWIVCCINKPNKWKKGLYIPLVVPTRP
jgi:hypothetical protein